MNLMDLREELAARSTPGDDLIAPARLSGVQARIGAIRRRRVAGAALAIVLAAAAAVGVGLLPRAATPPRPADPLPTERTINGFREWAVGAHLVANGTASLHEPITLTPAVGGLGVVLTARCETPVAKREIWLRWEVNGRRLGGTSCGPTTGGYIMPGDELWQEAGVRPGERVTVTVRVERANEATSAPEIGKEVPVPDGTFSAAVMDKVPFEEYPFPPRPAALTPLDDDSVANSDTDGALAVVESDRADPNAVRTVRVAVPGDASLDMIAQTPGTLEVRVDGKVLTTDEWWDYEIGVSVADLRPGEKGTRTVTLVFTPEHMTGAWRAIIRPRGFN